LRKDLLERSSADLHTMLSYSAHVEQHSLYNTPPVFAVYVLGLVTRWVLAQGGLDAMGRANERKAANLYAEIDRSSFYRGTAERESRSVMNVTFRLQREDLETRFVNEATAQGLDGLAGHRSVGGMRASLYNAFPEDGVDALVQFMREFERRNG
jgi:phosphoserine aminotransferase